MVTERKSQRELILQRRIKGSDNIKVVQAKTQSW